MERSSDPQRRNEAGFALVEAVIAVGLIALGAGTALTAAAALTHATTHDVQAASLALTAQNILTDLRAATAYDREQLQSLAGRSVTFTVDEPQVDGSSRRIAITAQVRHSAVEVDSFLCTVTARTADETALTLQATLVQEAPAPGSVLPAGIPPASDTVRPADAGDAGRIEL